MKLSLIELHALNDDQACPEVVRVVRMDKFFSALVDSLKSFVLYAASESLSFTSQRRAAGSMHISYMLETYFHDVLFQVFF